MEAGLFNNLILKHTVCHLNKAPNVLVLYFAADDTRWILIANGV